MVLSRFIALAAGIGLAAVAGLGLPLTAKSQEVPPEGIEIADVPLIAWVSSRAHALPSSLPDFDTDELPNKQFEALTKALANASWAEAVKAAKCLEYQLVAIEDEGKWYVVASDDTGRGRDPTIVVNTAPARDLILEAPHVPFEVGTAEQAVVLLRDLGGVAALVSGAHRCASKSFTQCDGKTPVCTGASTQYPDSDVGHNTKTLFHTAHLALVDRWKDAVVVSLHGMKEDGDGIRTPLIVSDGTKAADAEAAHPATKIRLALGNAAEPGLVTSCNLRADDQYKARPLCGTTNVQGRQVNGDADACHDSVEQGTGWFVHMEQDWSVLKPYAQNWSQIGDDARVKALVEAFKVVVPGSP